MSQNQTINKLHQMKLFGMARAYTTMLSSRESNAFTQEDIMNLLVESEWDDRENSKLQRLLKAAKFRY